MANPAKLKAAVAYLAGGTTPGKVQLFKLLYLADFTAYARLGHSITEETYEHWRMGPVPKTLWNAFRRRQNEYADIELVFTGAPRKTQLIRPKEGTNLAVLSNGERKMLDEVIEKYGKLSGAELRKLTHAGIPYAATQPEEIIPYYLAVYGPSGDEAQKPSREELQALFSDREYAGDLLRIAREMESERGSASPADYTME